MKVKVLYFAVLRERAGRNEEILEVGPETTAGELLTQVAAAFPALAAIASGGGSKVQVAVNRQVVPREHRLADGDEVALIPPVSGGSDRMYLIAKTPLSLDEVVRAVSSDAQGAVVTFIGNVRRAGALPDVVRLEYEAYEAMATEVLAGIGREIELEYPGAKIAIHHRIGTLAVGETAVVIAVSAPHRAEAFGACRVAIERLKQRAPIWKKEIGESGAVWVGAGA